MKQFRLLLLTIAIAAVVAQAFLGRTTATCESNQEALAGALERYHYDNKAYPDALNLLIPTYLDSIPSCPEAGADTYSLSYFTENMDGAYALYCRGAHHATPNFPASDSIHGLLLHPPVGDVETCLKKLEILRAAKESYTGDHSAPPNNLAELVPDYLDELPDCSGHPFLLARHPGFPGGDNIRDIPTAPYFSICCPGVSHLNEDQIPFFPLVGPLGPLKSAGLY